MKRTTLNLVIGLVALIPALAACGGDSGLEEAGGFLPGESGFVGELEGTDALVAVVLGADKALVYACNGEEGIAESFWVKPDDDGTTFTASSEHGSSVEFVVGDDGVNGTLVLGDGTGHRFSAEEARADAGLFLLVEGEGTEDLGGGWIVANDGSVRGALVREREFLTTTSPAGDDLVLKETEVSVAKIDTTSDDVITLGIMAPSNIVAPSDGDDVITPLGIIAPNNTIAPNNFTSDAIVARTPSPGGPIPIPFPN